MCAQTVRTAWVMMIPFSSWRTRGPRGFVASLGHTASAHTYPGRNSSCWEVRVYGQVWAECLKPAPTQGINNCCGPWTLLSSLQPRNPSGWEYSWRNRPREVKWFPPSHIATKWEPGVYTCPAEHPSPWLCKLLHWVKSCPFPSTYFNAFWWGRTFGWRESLPVLTLLPQVWFSTLGLLLCCPVIFRICTAAVWWLPWLLFLWYDSPPLLMSKECFQAANLGRRSQLLELKKKTKGEVPKRKV